MWSPKWSMMWVTSLEVGVRVEGLGSSPCSALGTLPTRFHQTEIKTLVSSEQVPAGRSGAGSEGKDGDTQRDQRRGVVPRQGRL